MFDVSDERQMARSLVSNRWGLVFVAVLPFWMLLANFMAQLSSGGTAQEGLVIFVLACVCTLGTMFSTYKLDRELMTWAPSRVGIVGLLVVASPVIIYQLSGDRSGANLARQGPELLQIIGFAGTGLLYATVVAAAAFLLFYFRHGATGRGPIEDDILDDE